MDAAHEGEGDRAASQKSPDAFRTISEVSVDLDVPQHVLRFWEGKFAQIRPLKRGGGRRYYRPEDVDLLRGIQHLLYGDGYTIKGVQKLLRENGVKHVVAAGRREPQAAKAKPAAIAAGPAHELFSPVSEAASAVRTQNVGGEPAPDLFRGGGEAGGGGTAPTTATATPPTQTQTHSLGGAPHFAPIAAPVVPAAAAPAPSDAQATATPAPEAIDAESTDDEAAESRRIETAAKLLARLKALRRDFDNRLQAAKNGR